MCDDIKLINLMTTLFYSKYSDITTKESIRIAIFKKMDYIERTVIKKARNIDNDSDSSADFFESL